MNSSIEELVTAIVDGDVHRYSEIVRRFDARVRQVVEFRVDDPAASDEIVQETFYRAFMRLDQLKDPEQLENWLVMVARNCANDHFRKSSRRRQTELACGRQTRMDGDEDDSNQNDQLWIWQEVEQLGMTFAQVLQLRYRQGMTYRQIAGQLSVPESTIRGRISEARKALKQRLINRGLFP